MRVCRYFMCVGILLVEMLLILEIFLNCVWLVR